MARQKITVRMARNILGDCFLITYQPVRPDGSEGPPTSILIDFGVLQAVEGARELMQAVGGSIRDLCGGHLDYLVITHEHADHISGFAHAGSLFFDEAGAPPISIGTLWMAWTENPKDEQANALRARHAPAFALFEELADPQAQGFSADDRLAYKSALDVFAFNALPEAPEAARVAGPAAGTRAGTLAGTLAGAVAGGVAAGGVAGTVQARRRTGAQIMEALKTTARQVDFLEPGDLRLIADPVGQAPPLRVHVLGPPRDHDLLYKSDPSGRNPETYLLDPSDTETLLAATGRTIDGGAVRQLAAPPTLFPDRYVALAEADPAGAGGAWRTTDQAVHDLWTAYLADEDRVLTVDGPGAAERLALKLDSDTNNTSLVLAFELADGQVLLFAADAQVGNWLSWDRQRYPNRLEDGGPGVDIHDLLSRVRLYKVGHHGSHNATIKMPGLESMTHPGLEVMIPVVESVARVQGRSGWKMPDPDLNKRLNEKAPGRILRGDDRLQTGEDAVWVSWELTVD